MKLKDTGLTVQDIKDKVNKYMIETYERFDFLAETAEGMYIYDALCKVSPVLHAFAKNGTKPIEYPSEPYPLTQKELIMQKERQRKKIEVWQKRYFLRGPIILN